MRLTIRAPDRETGEATFRALLQLIAEYESDAEAKISRNKKLVSITGDDVNDNLVDLLIGHLVLDPHTMEYEID